MAVDVHVACEQTIGEEISVNTWSARSATAVSPLGPIDAGVIADEFADFYSLGTASPSPDRGIDGIRPNNAVLTRVVVREIIAGSVVGGVFEFPFSNPGASADDILPLQVTAVVALRTATAGRSGRGRVFVGPFTESEVEENTNAGRLDAPAVATIFNAVEDLQDRLQAIAVTPYSLAVWSRADSVFRLVTSIRVNNKTGTQRRRQAQLSPTASLVGTI